MSAVLPVEVEEHQAGTRLLVDQAERANGFQTSTGLARISMVLKKTTDRRAGLEGAIVGAEAEEATAGTGEATAGGNIVQDTGISKRLGIDECFLS
jgi:hypothetical protein